MQNSKQTVSESKLDILDEETIFIKAYNNRLTSLFEYISELTGKKYNDSIYKNNLSLYNYSVISENNLNFKRENFLLSPCVVQLGGNYYQIFDKYKVKNLITEENLNVLEKILSGELLIFYSTDFEYIYLVCKDIYTDIETKICKILIN